jgi:hypothetical protein
MTRSLRVAEILWDPDGMPSRGSGIAVAALVDWRRDATVVQLTERVLKVDTQDKLERVAKAVQIGGLLAAIRERLPTGAWLAWVDEAVPYAHRTALVYIELDELRQAHPEDFARFRHLGPTKLHLILSQPARIRRHIRERVRLRIPDTGVLKPLDLVTVRELDAVIRDLAPTSPPANPIGPVLTAYAGRLEQLEAKTDLLIARADEVDRDEARALRDHMQAIIEKLEAGLRL